MISNAGGVKQYVTLVGRGVVGVDAATGKLLWSYNGVANGTANIPTPMVTGDYVFCSSGYGTGSALLKLNKFAERLRRAGSLFPRGQQDAEPPRRHDREGRLTCIAARATTTAFRCASTAARARTPGGPAAGPAAARRRSPMPTGHLYFRYQDGTMALIEANPNAYKLKGPFKIASHNGESWPHPVIAGGKLYLRDQDELLVYDVRRK